MPRQNPRGPCVVSGCGEYRLSSGPFCRGHLSGEGRNAESIRALRHWMATMSPGEWRRFEPQLNQAESMADQLDGGVLEQLGVYRQLLRDLMQRVDAVFGVESLDATSRVAVLIEQGAREREARGWG